MKNILLAVVSILVLVALLMVAALAGKNRVGRADAAKGGSDAVIRTGKKYKKKGVRTTLYLAKVAILTALGVVLLLIEFPIFPATPHLQLNISDVPSLLAAFMYGPVTGVLVSSLKVGLGLLIRGTSTAFVGDLSNLISGAVYALSAGLIYVFRRKKSGAILGLAVGSVLFMAIMWLANQFFLLPMFGISDKGVMMPYLWWTLLFNAIKCTVTSVVTFLLYKATHSLFNDF